MLKPARPARQDQEKLVATGSEQMKNARREPSSSWTSPLIPVGWSASEGDTVQVGPDRGARRPQSKLPGQVSEQVPLLNNEPSWLSIGTLDRSWKEELASPLLREISSYLFMKRSKGKQVQNLRPPRSGDLFLLNSDWSNKGRMQMWLFTSPSVLSEHHW